MSHIQESIPLVVQQTNQNVHGQQSNQPQQSDQQNITNPTITTTTNSTTSGTGTSTSQQQIPLVKTYYGLVLNLNVNC